MNVIGYTEEKSTLAVALSIDEIVTFGIDPWRLDLFDPAPIALPHNKQMVHFRKLTDVFFAYKLNTPRIYFGWHDGSQAMSGEADYRVNERNSQVELVNIRASRFSFAELFHKYLTLFQHAPERDDYFDLKVRDGVAHVFLPKPATAVKVHGGALRFDIGSAAIVFGTDLYPFSFTGSMFEPVQTGFVLPDCVNWVFANFNEGRPDEKPSVAKRTMRQVIAGEPVTTVEVFSPLAPFHLMGMLKERFGAKFLEPSQRPKGNMFGFLVGECRYLWNEADWSECRNPQTSWYSANTANAIARNEVRMPRIVMFDVAHKRARALFKFDEDYERERQRASLEADGYTLLDLT